MIIKRIFLITLIFGFLLWGILEAEEGEEEVFKLIVGETRIFSTNSPHRVAIGNPLVVDIVDVTKTEISLNAKSPGVTNFIYWDLFGEQSFKIKVLAEDMQLIKERLEFLLKNLNLPGVYTQVAEDEAKVLLLGNVKNSQDRERVLATLETLKDKIVDLIVVKEEETIVEIDVQVLELDKDATNTLGFTWPGSVTISTDQAATSTYTGITPAKWSTFFSISNWSRMPFEFKLDALIQEGKARILSRPRLACQSGKEAELLVGGEKPIMTTEMATTGGQGTNVEYKEYGIKLKIRPTVAEEERIKLSVNVEVSDVGTAETLGLTTAPTAKAYPLVKRTASTELLLNNGQTLSIGGLIKQKTEEELRRMPWLSQIPVLGAFFKKRTTRIGGGAGEKGSTELFITITPTIVKGEVKPAEKKIIPVSTPPESQTPVDPVLGYRQIIQKRIMENLTYPAQALQAGFQGMVKLSLHISYLGELLGVVVKETSGYKILDDNAVSVATSISTYPPFPPSIEETELKLDVPIIYKLDK
jgi:pilus assembly protein CpaC